MSGAVTTGAQRPNIVLILADDMGYSDLGCYGGEIETPHLDRLADHGLRFTQFYNTGRCWTTRAALLTGLYNDQAGMHDLSHQLNRRCVTIAEVLRSAGVSLVPAFAGKSLDREAIYFQHLGNRAVRAGKWKLVALKGKPWELYDLEVDRTETSNLIGQYPEKAKELAMQWHSWATEVGAPR